VGQGFEHKGEGFSMISNSNARLAALAGAAMVGAFSVATPAQAALMVSYNGGAPITDNGAGDTDATVGRIINTTVVGGFGITITVANSNSPGSGSGGVIQIQSLDVQNGGNATASLSIQTSDTGFTNPGTAGSNLTLTSSYGGTFTLGSVGDKVSFNSGADAANGQPASAVNTAVLTSTKANAGLITESFNGVNTANFVRGAGAYSMSNLINVTLSAGGQANVSGTTTATVTPEPASLAVLGGASLLLGRRRRA
jgi:hypothetical protein